MIEIVYVNGKTHEQSVKCPAGAVLLDALNVATKTVRWGEEHTDSVRVEVHYREAE